MGDDTSPVARCMFEGCDATRKTRGMLNHVRWSDDEIHGPRGHVPEEYDLDKCEIVAETPDRTKNEPTEPEPSGPGQSRYLCLDCGAISRGYRGHTIHVGRSSHPEHAAGEVNMDRTVEFPVDHERKVIRVPSTAYLHGVSLSKDELNAGYSIEVDRNLETPERREAVNSVQEALRAYYTKVLAGEEPHDPVEAYRRASAAVAAGTTN